MALQNVVDQTQALHTLKSKGVNIRAANLAFLSPYATSKLKRFGDYPTDLKLETMPTQMTLPSKDWIEVAGFARILPPGVKLVPSQKSRLMNLCWQLAVPYP